MPHGDSYNRPRNHGWRGEPRRDFDRNRGRPHDHADEHRLRGKTVTIRWIDSSVQWNWFRVLGFDSGLVHLQPVDITGTADDTTRDAFWTPVQSIDRLVTRHVHDADLADWLRQPDVQPEVPV